MSQFIHNDLIPEQQQQDTETDEFPVYHATEQIQMQLNENTDDSINDGKSDEDFQSKLTSDILSSPNDNNIIANNSHPSNSSILPTSNHGNSTNFSSSPHSILTSDSNFDTLFSANSNNTTKSSATSTTTSSIISDTPSHTTIDDTQHTQSQQDTEQSNNLSSSTDNQTTTSPTHFFRLNGKQGTVENNIQPDEQNNLFTGETRGRDIFSSIGGPNDQTPFNNSSSTLLAESSASQQPAITSSNTSSNNAKPTSSTTSSAPSNPPPVLPRKKLSKISDIENPFHPKNKPTVATPNTNNNMKPITEQKEDDKPTERRDSNAVRPKTLLTSGSSSPILPRSRSASVDSSDSFISPRSLLSPSSLLTPNSSACSNRNPSARATTSKRFSISHATTSLIEDNSAQGSVTNLRAGDTVIKIWVCSWNMAAKEMDPSQQSHLTQFLPAGYDIYVVGVQECISPSFFSSCESYLSQHNCVRYPITSQVSGRGDGAWRYTKSTAIACFVSERIRRHVQLCKEAGVSLGFTEGSKGAAGFVLKIFSTTIAFLSCHMSSRTISDRRDSYTSLIEGLGNSLGDHYFQLLEQFHHIVWCGDCNYRLQSLSAPLACQYIQSGDLQSLQKHDELTMEIQGGRAFWRFKEPPILFLPTYKKHDGRPTEIDYHDVDWVDKVYLTLYKEP